MRATFRYAISRRAMRRLVPAAAVIARADGGHIAFETVDEYRRWRGQR